MEEIKARRLELERAFELYIEEVTHYNHMWGYAMGMVMSKDKEREEVEIFLQDQPKSRKMLIASNKVEDTERKMRDAFERYYNAIQRYSFNQGYLEARPSEKNS